MADRAAFLAGRTSFVTGASSGIGKELTHQLLDLGVKVALVGRDEGRLRTAAGDAPTDGHMLVTCDVRDDAQVKQAVTSVEHAWGGIDILVNSAGSFFLAPLPETTNDMWDELWQTNVNGTVYPTRAALPGMLERGSGTIVILSSVSARRGFANNSAYAATKYAVTGFARALTTEVRRQGVRVIDVAAGPVDTPIWGNYDTPMEREDMLKPGEVAKAIIAAMTVSETQVMQDVLLLPQKGVYL
jgi:NADP-dependent 3-hydroxy acid dehydrogenase YdfG